MKVTLSWLKQYVDFDCWPEQLTKRFTRFTIASLPVFAKQRILPA